MEGRETTNPIDMQKRDYILTKNYKQYTAYCSDNNINPKDHAYINDKNDIHGVDGRDKYMFCVGQWWLNPFADEILATAQSRGFKLRRFS